MPDFITISPTEGLFPMSASSVNVTYTVGTIGPVTSGYSTDGWYITYVATNSDGTTQPVAPQPIATADPEEDNEERAWRMVRGLLSAQERRLLARYDYLPLKSRLHPGFIYRLECDGEPPAVYYRGKQVGSMCIGCYDEYLPDADTFLMHKLLIEADEETYLRTANLNRGVYTTPACAWLEE